MSVKVNPFYGCKWYEVICNGRVDWLCKWYQWYLVLRTSKNFLSANKLSRRNLNWTSLFTALPPPSPLFRERNLEQELASLFYVYFWEGSDFHDLRFTIIFYGIFTVFRNPRWFSPFKKIVWYTNRSVISTQWTKLTCVYQTNMCLYSRMRYANQQLTQWHKHKHKTR